MYLVDTNIFLEILLNQDKSQICKDFLNKNIKNLYITDFSLHSIGVILFRQDKEATFSKFVKDILSKVSLITLPKNLYNEVVKSKHQWKLDFDDAYQHSVCKHYGYKLITMDQDFHDIDDIAVSFL